MTGDISEIEKLVIQGSSIFVAGLFFGTTMDIVTEPIKVIVSKIYGGIHPEIRRPINTAVSITYENAKMTRKSLRKSFYNDISLNY